MKEKIRIVVEGFPEEKKKLVQDAMFKLGYLWKGHVSHYDYLDNTVGYYYGDGEYLTYGDGKYLTYNWVDGESYAYENSYKTLTFEQLMEKAGMSKFTVGDKVILKGTFKCLDPCEANFEEHCLLDTWPNGTKLEVIAFSSVLGENLPVVRNLGDGMVSTVLEKYLCSKTDNQIQQELLGKQLKDLQTQMDVVQSQYNKLKGE